MIDIKSDFSGGLNLDDAYYAVPKNCYVDALNITRDAISGSNDRVITNVFGNRLIPNIKSDLLRIDVPNTYEDVSIYINTNPVSSNTRTVVTLNLQPANTPTKILDFTSSGILSVGDYIDQAVNSMFSSITTATGVIMQGGNITPGTYNGVIQSFTSGDGFEAKFNIVVIGGNLLGAITIVDGGLNYKVNDTITISGNQFGGISGQDDVYLTVSAVSLRDGVLSASANAPNEISIRYNLDSNIGTYYSWNSYSLSVGHLTSGYTCIGAYPNQTRNTIVYFLHQTQGYHIILEYNIDTELITKIFESRIDSGGIDVLNFDLQSKITGINIFNRDEGDLLYFLDTLGRPTGMDVVLFKNNEYNPVTRDIIDVCKRPPLAPPSMRYNNDNSKFSNNLRGKFFKFKYRYVYDDFSKSVCSPISKVNLPYNILNIDYTNIITNNNYIQLEFNSGDKDVKKIELLMSYVDKTNDWSDFVLIETIEKEVKYSVYSYLNDSFNIPILNGGTNITLGGSAVFGASIQIYFTDLNTSTEILISTWNIQVDQELSNVATSLAGSTIISATINAIANDVSIIFNYDTTAWSFSRVVISYPLGVDNLNYGYRFYNDSTYQFIDVNESIQLYDYVPKKAKAQELVNGNVLLYGAITEGYNKDLNPSVLVNILQKPTDTQDINQGFLSISTATKRLRAIYIFSGLPPAGTLIQIKVNYNNVQTLMASYTTNASDTLSSIIINLHASIAGIAAIPYNVNDTAPYPDGNPFLYPGSVPFLNIESLAFAPFSAGDVIITLPGGGVNDNPLPTFLFNSQRNIGIAYFDEKGKTNGIIWNKKLSFPDYEINTTTGQVLLPYINCKIYHQPPIWAKSFQFYLTKNSIQFLYWYATVSADDNYLYWDISSLYLVNKDFPTRATVESWSFQEGDRFTLLRSIYNPFPNQLFAGAYDTEVLGIIFEPNIGGTIATGKTFIKINRQGVFATTAFNGKQFYEFVIYRNKIPSNTEIYYEFGQQYYIANPGTNNRSHLGGITNQNITTNIPAEFNFYDGDVYFRQRFTIPIPGDTFFGNYYVLDKNIVDEYISGVSSVSGRPNIVDQNAKEAYFPAMVRFGQAYQPNTSINGIPRFFFANFDEYDYTFGDIMRFKTRDRFLRVFQKLRVGMVPLYQQMVKNQGTETLVISDKLLNPIQYYQGVAGIGDNPESLASYTYADYFTSNIRGVICRASQDGVELISITNKVNSWANAQVGDLAKRFMIGCFDQRLSNYILYLSQSTNNEEVTIVYDQEYGNFETFLSLYPEMMASLGVTLASFKNGDIYIHDNSPFNTFFGLPPADSTITPVFNQNAYQKKTFLAISEVASDVWDCPEVRTDLISYGTNNQLTIIVPSDFARLEGTYEAPILRDFYSLGSILNGDTMKGKYLVTKFRKAAASSLVTLNIVSCKYIDSPLTNR